MVTAAWVSQSVEDQPTVLASVVVGGVAYLVPGNDSGTLTIIKASADGSFTEYDLAGDVQTKSVAAAGSKIFLTGIQYDGAHYRGLLQVFDITTGTVTSHLFDDPAVARGPKYGAGTLASDGNVYFPPVLSMDGLKCSVLVVDPSTEAISFTTFGGTYTVDVYGHACMGGDGLLYFLPGLQSAAGGGGYSGGHMGRVDLSTGTFTADTTPLEGIFNADTFIWTVQAPDGVYGATLRNRIHKFTASTGAVLMSFAPIGTVQSTAAVGADGKLYTVGRDQSGTSGKDPMLVQIDPATDAVSYQSFPALAGPNFIPGVTYRVGSTIRAFPVYVGVSYPDLFVATLSAFSFAVGAIPVSLAVGALPVTGSVG